jgi:hypothetical protein
MDGVVLTLIVVLIMKKQWVSGSKARFYTSLAICVPICVGEDRARAPPLEPELCCDNTRLRLLYSLD